MVDDHLELGATVLPAAGSTPLGGRAALCWSAGLLEGAAAGIVAFVPSAVYHVGFLQVPVLEAPLGLFAALAVATGTIYGSFAAVGAAKLLDRTRSPQALVASGAVAWTGAFAVALFAAFLLGVADDLSRVSFTSAWLLGLPLLAGLRSALITRLIGRIRAGRLRYQKIAVVGHRQDVERFLAAGNLSQAGFAVSGTFYLEAGDEHLVSQVQRWVGRGVEDIVFVGEPGDIAALGRIVDNLKRFAVNLVCAPASGTAGFKYLDVVHMGPSNALRFLKKPMGDGAVIAKRSFDLIGAAIGLVLLAPLFAVVAVLIKLDSPGPVFYRQERRGFNGESFRIWKFRSMRVTESGRAMVQARKGDARITAVGHFIRQHSIDELPQLFNVLLGTMSLVGPRPHAIIHDDELGHQVARYVHRQRIKPGITGWAQVNGFRGETTTLTQIEGRTAHDLFYADNWSLLFDIRIIWLTVFSAKTRQNAH